MDPHWRHFEHKADIGLCGCGPTLASAFEQAALALTAVVTEPQRVEAQRRIEIRCQAPDIELLLYDWLNAVILQMATRKWLFGHSQVAIDGLQLRATLWGEPVAAARHRPAVEPKGATLTALSVEQLPDGWCARCVVDV
ncbi:archease [Marinobacterium arenosum]|uniref:archease n=1 Tax=Marinobacterium arenosum TaxID=2862496 RepID=UPI001C970BCB|nr:archease [Marinobacterium arenosum]MBY4678567.1 archease [Marinobacterium arenosum]